jgi:mannose-6-phosphate isomerase
VWGYKDLRPWYERTAEGEPIGEVWLTGDDCTIATGPHTGQTLASLFAGAPDAMLGSSAQAPGSPLLIKMIFAREKLSVQVHPDDKMARKYGEPRGKTECWYALDAQPGAEVALGIKPGTTPEEARVAIQESRLEELLNLIPVNKGDMIFVDAGTIHAVWPGAVLLETQQTSDLTYRMYDYGRPRELHLDKSLEAMRLKTGAGKVAPKNVDGHSILIDQKYFRVERWKESLPSVENAAADVVQTLFVVDGKLRIEGDSFQPFSLDRCQIVVIPGGARNWKISPESAAEVIRILPQFA